MKDVSKKQFDAVVKIVGDKDVVPERKATNKERARIYGLYKRATFGKLHGPYGSEDKDVEDRPKSRPNAIKVEARAKYDAWDKCQDMSQQEAMNEYVKLAYDTVGQKVKTTLKSTQ